VSVSRRSRGIGWRTFLLFAALIVAGTIVSFKLLGWIEDLVECVLSI
jgi:hypothetical protein